MKTFNQISQSAIYREDEIAVSLTCCGGSYGGGSEVLIIQGVDDESILGRNANLRDADEQK